MIDELYEFRKLKGDEIFIVFDVLNAIKIRPFIEAKLKETNDLGLDKKGTIEYIMKDLIFYLIENINLAKDNIKLLITSYIEADISYFKELDIDEIYLILTNMFGLGLGTCINKFFKSGFLQKQNVQSN